MGLALVYRIVRLCNGKIQVNSEPDKGSEFIVTFSTDKSS
ncbi:ATP-binding protein [Paenibacillus sp. IHB B 3084]|nr:ATP-binding protein [Paenibacillus sp. IHB B 3084]